MVSTQTPVGRSRQAGILSCLLVLDPTKGLFRAHVSLMFCFRSEKFTHKNEWGGGVNKERRLSLSTQDCRVLYVSMAPSIGYEGDLPH